MVNQPKQPDESHNSLDHAKDSSCQQASVVALDTDLKILSALCHQRTHIALRYTYRFEDSRAVIVDGIDTRSILPEEQGAAEEQTPLDLIVGSGSLERLPETNADSTALLLQSLVNGTNLLNHIDIVLGKLANPTEVLDGLFAATASEEPTR